jgi:hypothetical protein
MGLFTNSETTFKKNQVSQDVASLNMSLRNIVSILDNQGLNGFTYNSINTILENIEPTMSRMSNTVRCMSDSELSGFTVPWTDGRNLGIMTWITSYCSMMDKIGGEMERYTR